MTSGNHRRSTRPLKLGDAMKSIVLMLTFLLSSYSFAASKIID